MEHGGADVNGGEDGVFLCFVVLQIISNSHAQAMVLSYLFVHLIVVVVLVVALMLALHSRIAGRRHTVRFKLCPTSIIGPNTIIAPSNRKYLKIV